MTPPFQSTAICVRQLLQQSWQLALPWSQRCYAWQKPEASLLVEDLLEALSRLQRRRYWLGQMYLAETGDADRLWLVDGNQRTTSLAILLATLRDLSPDTNERQLIDSLLWLPMASGETVRRPRLKIQDHSAGLFATHVLESGGTQRPPPEAIVRLETDLRLIENRDQFVERLRVLSGVARSQLLRFILDDCWLATTLVADLDEANEILHREESRGRHHHPSDELKFDLVSLMPEAQQIPATDLWDVAQARIGAEQMVALVGHSFTIAKRRRLTKPLKTLIAKHFSLSTEGLAFVANHLTPRADLIEMLLGAAIDAGAKHTAAVNHRLRLLGWIDHRVWQAPAIYWLEERGAFDPATERFFDLLDRVTWLMRLAGADPVVQENAFISMLTCIREGSPLEQWPAARLPDVIPTTALNHISSRTFGQKQYCQMLLQRIDAVMARSQGIASVGPPPIPTIEHILPRSLAEGGADWKATFPRRDELKAHCDRLGNLIPLSAEQNRSAGNRSFRDKRVLYRQSEFHSARDIAERWETWDRRAITERTEAILDLLWADFGLTRSR